MGNSNFNDFRVGGSDNHDDMFKTWGLIGLFGIADTMNKRNNIEEERLMLEKVQAMDDMSIYEDYIKQRNERDRRIAEERKTAGIVIAIVTVIFFIFFFLMVTGII